MAAKKKKKKSANKKAAARKAPPRKAAKKVAPKAKRADGKLRLTMMTGGYEIVRALQEGTVQPKGI